MLCENPLSLSFWNRAFTRPSVQPLFAPLLLLWVLIFYVFYLRLFIHVFPFY